MEWTTSSSQFFSYYPKYEYLDSVLSATSRKRMNLFIDVKGCAKSLYQEWAIRHVLDHSKNSNTVDTSLFAGVLEFIAFHKTYAKKRQIELNMYFFMESGKSSYHLDVYKDYKCDRGLSDMFGLDLKDREAFFQILDKNYHVLNKVVNRLPNCNFVRLNFLEADFIPWHLMKHVLTKEDVDSAANIIYSTDKDMLQCLDAPNIFQFYRHAKNVKMMSYKDIYTHWLKGVDIPINDPASWFPMALSIIGDSGDGFAGVKGVGPVKIVEVFDYVMTICGRSMQLVYDNITNKKPIFDKEYQAKDAALKLIMKDHDIVVRNLKLASFKLLSDAVNGGFPTDMIDKRKQIEECSRGQNKCTGAGILIGALNQNGLMGVVTEQTVINLF